MSVQASFETIQLLEELFKPWEAWEQNRTYYLNTLLPELMNNPQSGSDHELAIIRRLKRIATSEEWEHLIEIAESLATQKRSIIKAAQTLDLLFEEENFPAAKAYIAANSGSAFEGLYVEKRQTAINRVWYRIRVALGRLDFQKAELHFSKIEPYLSKEELDLFSDLVQAAMTRQEQEEKERFIEKTVQTLHHLLDSYEFSAADNVFAQIKDHYPEDTYRSLVQSRRQQQAREQLISSIHSTLILGDIEAADHMHLSNDLLKDEEFLEIKVPHLERLVREKYTTPLSLEQVAALANPSRNQLVSARAGSGKTTVLACKASLLIDCEHVHPDQILVMAFNTKAADEIRERIRRVFRQARFENARTFHSLAFQLVQPTEDLLFDDSGDILSRKMTLFVQRILKEEIKNSAFIGKMYRFFRREMAEIERAGFFQEGEHYFVFRRNLRQVTLNGEIVKSMGEKYIADFLFEHDIPYRYEEVNLWGNQIYRPDFSMFYEQQKFVIEHWGIDEYDASKRVPPEWTQTWDEYHAQMQAKRAFWRKEGVTLIETSVRDLQQGREAFEAVLGNRLAQNGISRERLSSADLEQKITKDYTITRLAELLVQFIQRAKKQMLKAEDIQEHLRNYEPEDAREAVFIDLACRVYLEYERVQQQQKKIDFDDVMMLAIDKIHQTRGNCEIMLGHPKHRSVRMNDLRWILLDEYQDFSNLFYHLIAAVQLYNPSVRIFCVGDDWQAINGFAGSDLHYFHRFTDLLNDAVVQYIVTNYRSRAEIVQAGNRLMHGKGQPADYLPDSMGGDIHIEYIDDVWIEMRGDEQNIDQKTEDERFLVMDTTNGGRQYPRVIASKYLKLCYEIISAPENQGKSVAILNRTGRIDGLPLEDFRSILLSCFPKASLSQLKPRIDVETVHKYKGLEADLVVILNASEGMFPLLHPDNALFRFFGKTLIDAYAEEQRLFYVALTRAKQSLYILTERGRESSFLTSLLPR